MSDPEIGTGVNQIVPFANGVGPNVETPVDWIDDPIRALGFQAGEASAQQYNTVNRQACFIASMLAQFAADFCGRPSNDDGDVLQEEQNFIDALRSRFSGIYFVTDIGTANAMKGTPISSTVTGNFVTSVVPTAYNEKMLVIAKKCPFANTGAMTANFWGIGTVALLDNTGAPLSAAALIGNSYYILNYCGGHFRVLGGVAEYETVTNLAAADGDMIDVVEATTVVNWRTLLGTHNATILDLDRWPRGEAATDKDEYVTSLELLDWINKHYSSPSAGMIGIQVITASQTYTKTAGTKYVLVIATGGGGAGSVIYSCGAGGGAGATCISFIDLTNINSVACTIGAGGIGVQAPANGLSIGGNGGQTSFGTYAVAGGGPGGSGQYEPTTGGTPITGNMKIYGGDGKVPKPSTSGSGGASFWGGGGSGDSFHGPENGNGYAGEAYGAGGGGGESDTAFTGKTGGNGKSGVILVIEFGSI